MQWDPVFSTSCLSWDVVALPPLGGIGDNLIDIGTLIAVSAVIAVPLFYREKGNTFEWTGPYSVLYRLYELRHYPLIISGRGIHRCPYSSSRCLRSCEPVCER